MKTPLGPFDADAVEAFAFLYFAIVATGRAIVNPPKTAIAQRNELIALQKEASVFAAECKRYVETLDKKK